MICVHSNWVNFSTAKNGLGEKVFQAVQADMRGPSFTSQKSHQALNVMKHLQCHGQNLLNKKWLVHPFELQCVPAACNSLIGTCMIYEQNYSCQHMGCAIKQLSAQYKALGCSVQHVFSIMKRMTALFRNRRRRARKASVSLEK